MYYDVQPGDVLKLIQKWRREAAKIAGEGRHTHSEDYATAETLRGCAEDAQKLIQKWLDMRSK